MVVSGQFHAQAILSLGSGWASDAVWTIEKIKSLASAKNWALVPRPDILTLRLETPCISN
jgi:hypothetical protein